MFWGCLLGIFTVPFQVKCIVSIEINCFYWKILDPLKYIVSRFYYILAPTEETKAFFFFLVPAFSSLSGIVFR